MTQCTCESCRTVRQARKYSLGEKPTDTKTKSGRKMVPARMSKGPESAQRFFALFGISHYYPSAVDIVREWYHRRRDEDG